jgi:pilus assembly protein CpaF
MFTIVIQEKGGEQRRMVFNKTEITIGRVQGNDIVLPKGNVSKRHARIVLKDSKFIIVDLKSTNGTYVNGRKITSPLVVKDSDKIYIGDFIIGVDEAASGEAAGDGGSDVATAPPPMGVEKAGAQLLESGASASASGRVHRPTEGGSVPSLAVDSPPVRTPPQVTPPMAGPPMAAPPGARPVPGPVSPPRPRPAGGTLPPPMVPMGGIPPLSAPPMGPPPMGPPPMGPPPMGPPPMAIPPAMASPLPAMTEIAPPAPPLLSPPSPAISAPLPASSTVTSTGASPIVAGARKRAPTAMRRVNARPVPVVQNRGVVVPPLDAKAVKMLDLQTAILERVRSKLDLDKLPVERLADEDMWQRAERVIVDMVQSLEASGEVPNYIEHDLLIKETINEALGLGPLEDLLADDSIDEIIVDRKDRVIVGKDGQLRGAGKAFSSDDVVVRVIERLVAPSGVSLAQHPMVDVRLRDGSRLTAAVPPISTRGPCLVLKKPMARPVTLQELTSAGALSSAIAEFLAMAVKARRNILVCGGPSSGKTSVVAALAHASSTGERIISVEQVSELALARDEWVALECRPADGRNQAITLDDLVQKAIRMHPDRLVIGEVIGSEALSIATSLASTIDGATAAVAGEGALAALGRMALLARTHSDVADSVARELVAQAFEVVIHVARGSDGKMRVVAVDEVIASGEQGFEVSNLFGHRDGNFFNGSKPRFEA